MEPNIIILWDNSCKKHLPIQSDWLPWFAADLMMMGGLKLIKDIEGPLHGSQGWMVFSNFGNGQKVTDLEILNMIFPWYCKMFYFHWTLSYKSFSSLWEFYFFLSLNDHLCLWQMVMSMLDREKNCVLLSFSAKNRGNCSHLLNSMGSLCLFLLSAALKILLI